MSNEIIELKDGTVILDKENQTCFYNTEGEQIFTLKFRTADPVILQAIFDAWNCAYSRGHFHGERFGRSEMVAAVHELLGIDKLIEVLKK